MNLNTLHTMPTTKRPNVFIAFQDNEESRPIIDAILADNPEAKSNPFPAMTKIDCPGRLEIRAESVSERLGRDWDPQEIHLSVISLSGSVDEDDGVFAIFWR